MRIIAGSHKGRQLKSVSGKETRPTSDKIKEAVFHRMGPFFDGGNGLDLFAGSGSLGIEAISRGMDHMIFIEKSPQAIRTINKNIDLVHCREKCEIYRNDAFRALDLLKKTKKQFDLVLLDPPYEKIHYQQLLDSLEEKNVVNENGFVYVEHNSSTNITMSDAFHIIFDKKYSETTSVTIFRKS